MKTPTKFATLAKTADARNTPTMNEPKPSKSRGSPDNYEEIVERGRQSGW